MRRLLGGALAALLVGLALVWAQPPASAWLVQAPAGGGGAFAGVGDVQSGARLHWGLIAYNSATKGSNLIALCNSTGGVDVACANVASDATTGLVSSTQVISGHTCTSSGECTIKQYFDDSGSNGCSGGPCNTNVQSTVANRHLFIPNDSGTLPGIRCNGQAGPDTANWTSISGISYGVIVSANTTTDPGGSNNDLILGSNTNVSGNDNYIGVKTGLQYFIYNGTATVQTSNLALNTFFAIIQNTVPSGGGTGQLWTNGTSWGTNAIGSHGIAAAPALCAGVDLFPPFGFNHAGDVLEVAIWPADISANEAALTSKMRTNGGF